MNRKQTIGALIAVAGVLAALAATAFAKSNPSVATGPITKKHDTNALATGTVNPNGSPTYYRFEYGLTTGYGVNTRVMRLRAGTKAVKVNAGLTHLEPGTTYHYRLVALNKFGGALGRDRVFTTPGNPPPFAATGPATGVSRSTATFTGTVTTNKQPTAYYFRYGVSTSYGSNTPMQHLVGSKVPITVEQSVAGLASGTVFHYQLVVVNRGLTRYGNDEMFMTYPNPTPTPTVHAKTTPHHKRHRPFVFTTRGRITHPGFIPDAYACSQSVRIKFRLKHRVVATTLAAVQPDCTFAAATVFKHRPGHHRHRKVTLTVTVRFIGNGYLTPAKAHKAHVTLG